MTSSLDSVETSSSNQHSYDSLSLASRDTNSSNCTYTSGLIMSVIASSQLDFVFAARAIASLSSLCFCAQAACLPLVHAHVTEPQSSQFATPPPPTLSFYLSHSATHTFTLG